VAAWKRLEFDRATIFGHQQVAGKQVSEIDDPSCQIASRKIDFSRPAAILTLHKSAPRKPI
jgi:hypothetical protein